MILFLLQIYLDKITLQVLREAYELYQHFWRYASNHCQLLGFNITYNTKNLRKTLISKLFAEILVFFFFLLFQSPNKLTTMKC